VGRPCGKLLFLFGESNDQTAQLNILPVADYDWANVLLFVSLVVEVGPVQCFFMLLDAIFMVILNWGSSYLNGDFSQNAEGGMPHINLPINIKGRGLFGDEASIGKHFGSIEGFAHGDMLEVLNITFK
jgi:hypothetical protein